MFTTETAGKVVGWGKTNITVAAYGRHSINAYSISIEQNRHPKERF